jgi:phenylpropionate dioxygenase-like ring-hydroxylating dioxygenase large terminal subunit
MFASTRGRRLLEGCGKSGPVIFCPFHGWRWNRDGSLNHVTARQDFEGIEGFTDEALALKGVRFERWGGWIWVTMNPDAPPLVDYLAPLPEYLKISSSRIPGSLGTRRSSFQSIGRRS